MSGNSFPVAELLPGDVLIDVDGQPVVKSVIILIGNSVLDSETLVTFVGGNSIAFMTSSRFNIERSR